MMETCFYFTCILGLIVSLLGLAVFGIIAVKHFWLSCIEASNEISIAQDRAKVKRTLEKVGQ